MIITDQYAPMIGGVPTVTRDLACDLAARGHSVLVVAPAYPSVPSTDIQGDVTLFRCSSIAWPAYRDQRIARLPVVALRGLIRHWNPAIIHTHSVLALGAVARMLAKRERRPLVATHHYLPINAYPSLIGVAICSQIFQSIAMRYLLHFYNGCDLVTAPTATALRPLIQGGLRVPSQVMSNGIDLSRFSPGPPDSELRRRFGFPAGLPLILSLNRLSPEKRPEVLVAAAAALSQPSHVAIAGDGPLAHSLRRQVDRLKLSGRVTFLGHVPNDCLVPLYRCADIFVIPSEAELQSLVTMEAMACGLPIVAADALALPELVHHGETGLLFQAGDTRDLAACLDTLAASASMRMDLGMRGRDVIETHDRTAVVAEWEKVYHALLG
jgi:glycosyltransferase involved in cell wall biosynthesis